MTSLWEVSPRLEVKDEKGTKFLVFLDAIEKATDLKPALLPGKKVKLDGYWTPFGFDAKLVEVGQSRFVFGTSFRFGFQGEAAWTKEAKPAEQPQASAQAPAQAPAKPKK